MAPLPTPVSTRIKNMLGKRSLIVTGRLWPHPTSVSTTSDLFFQSLTPNNVKSRGFASFLNKDPFVFCLLSLCWWCFRWIFWGAIRHVHPPKKSTLRMTCRNLGKKFEFEWEDMNPIFFCSTFMVEITNYSKTKSKHHCKMVVRETTFLLEKSTLFLQ